MNAGKGVRARRGWLPVAVAAAVVVGATGTVYAGQALQADGGSASSRPHTSSRSLSSRELATQSLLARLDRAVAARDPSAFRSNWLRTPAAQRSATATLASLMRLQVSQFSMHVDEGAVGAGGPAWTVGVDVTWRLAGLGGAPAHSTLVGRFRAVTGRAVLAGLTVATATHQPIWLARETQLRRSPRTLVVGSDPGQTRRVALLLGRAVHAVGAVLPHWHGRLLAYVPSTESQFTALVAARPRDYDGIAAVTTTIDGSESTRTPSVVVVNPTVFDPLGALSAQVVVTHEATHAATGAAAVTMPLWVAEGFADYVAIGSVQVPTAEAAARALTVVRRSGAAPAALPGASAFDASGRALEAAYEESWLANALIAREYGRPALVEFYFAVEQHRMSVDDAFRSLLHTSRTAFTEVWRGYLARLAGES